jgi:hypothetical protein
MPIVGQFGSLAGFGMFPGGALESIATITIGSGGASSITFSDIPGGFQHLQIRGFTPFNVRDGVIQCRANGDTTTANYRYHWLSGNGASASAYSFASGYIEFAYDGNAAPNSSAPKAFVLDLLDYASTSKAKTTRSFCGIDVNGGGMVQVTSGLWTSTAAVTSLVFTQSGNLGGYGAQNFAQHTTFALFGVRA